MSNPKLKAMARELGREGGKIGGRSRSPEKVEAGRRNLAKARATWQRLLAEKEIKKSPPL